MAEGDAPTLEESRRDMLEGTLIERARAVIHLAWQVGSGLDAGPEGMLVKNPELYCQAVLNGLLALSMVEVMAPPGEAASPFYSPVRLAKVLDG